MHVAFRNNALVVTCKGVCVFVHNKYRKAVDRRRQCVQRMIRFPCRYLNCCVAPSFDVFPVPSSPTTPFPLPCVYTLLPSTALMVHPSPNPFFYPAHAASFANDLRPHSPVATISRLSKAQNNGGQCSEFVHSVASRICFAWKGSKRKERDRGRADKECERKEGVREGLGFKFSIVHTWLFLLCVWLGI